METIKFCLPDLIEGLKDNITRIWHAGGDTHISPEDWAEVAKGAQALADATRPLAYNRLAETVATLNQLIDEAGHMVAIDGPIDDYYDDDAWEYRSYIRERVFDLLIVIRAVFDGYFAGFEDGRIYGSAVQRGLRVRHPDLG